uniref:ImpA N-terminal domain-containing protein n=1 Tax=uncultured proteobacterium QS1 TaxID=288647 RepID=Q6B362_9PROT|nr:conserved hypothetical protein [uncultured proteobacterium QS1]
MDDDKLSGIHRGVEFDSHYSEAEFILSQFDSQTDPLSRLEEIPVINWNLICEHSELLLAKCFDLRVVLWLMRANLHLEGISALFVGAANIDTEYSLGESTIFPQADTDQAVDSIHAAALGWLATPQCLHEIKNSRIFPDNRLTVDELLTLRFSDQERRDLHFSEAVRIISHADAFFASKGIPSLGEQLTLGIQALERIENYANVQAKDYRLDCRNVRDYLQGLSLSLYTLEQQSASVIEDEGAQALPDVRTSIVSANKTIRSRQDVILLLDQVLDYFQQYEPSHPAPILIRRSQKMIGMDFVTIVEELLPESLVSLLQLSGK